LLLLLCGFALAQKRESVELANEYYRMGEVDKAKDLYSSLAKNSQNISFIHKNYLNVLLQLDDFNEAEKYIDKVLRWYPENINYMIDKGFIYVRAGEINKADSYFNELIEMLSFDQYQTRRAVQYMLQQQLTSYAILALQTTRVRSKDPFLFSIDLANIYRMQNNKQKMVEEYLNFAIQNPRNLQYVQNTFQVLLTEPEDFESLERMLFDYVQQHPENEVYAEMLIWVSLQQKNFYGAFIQARALDKRLQMGGSKILNVGVIALNNDDYENAIMIFDYLADNYKETNTAIQAQLYRIRARESLVKTTYPVNLTEVQKLVDEYNGFISMFSNNYSSQQASLNKAKLYGYYLDNNDSAIYIISALLQTPRLNPNLAAQAKLDLADIYLLDNQPWESALLYAQVDKTMKETPLGYEAKLRNAKLAYYRGDFVLAQEYLDILKMATSREIANDALDLSIFIQSNTALDTSTMAMQQYADIELLLYQNKTAKAIDEIAKMLEKYPGHDLTDDLLYLEATIRKESGEFSVAATLLKKISEEYSTGLLGAKSYYELAVITQDYLNNEEEALQLYTEFLKKYPGSIYTTDARKRLRIIRGDSNFVEQPEVN
jgi:tetratricopeptide (TPR) repeat protein